MFVCSLCNYSPHDRAHCTKPIATTPEANIDRHNLDYSILVIFTWIYIAIDIIINRQHHAITIVQNSKMNLPPIQPQNTMKRSSISPDKKKPNGGDYAPSPPSPTRRRASFEAASVLANLGLSSSRDASPTMATTTAATGDDSKLPSTNSTSTKHKYKSSPSRNDVPMTFPEKVGNIINIDCAYHMFFLHHTHKLTSYHNIIKITAHGVTGQR